MDEFRTHADLDGRARWQPVISAGQPNDMTVDARLVAVHRGRYDIHAGRADEIANEGMRGLVEQLRRSTALHDATVMHTTTVSAKVSASV